MLFQVKLSIKLSSQNVLVQVLVVVVCYSKKKKEMRYVYVIDG